MEGQSSLIPIAKKLNTIKLDRSFSNNVLMYKTNKDTTYYLPAYLRLNFKKITTINIDELDAEMSANILLAVYYGDLPAEYVQTIKNNMELQINREKSIRLCDSLLKEYTVKMKDNPEKSILNFNLRAKLPLQLYCQDIFYSPFDTQELEVTVTIRSITVKDQCGKPINFAFNLMELPPMFMVTMFNMSEDNKGEFAVAPGLRKVEYLNKLNEDEEKIVLSGDQREQRRRKILSALRSKGQEQRVDRLLAAIGNSEQTGQKNFKLIQHFQYARFKFNIYKYPITTVLLVFMPIVLLAIINLAIFFQELSMSGKIASIASLMVAFMAFLPTIRDRIPPSPKVTAMDLILGAFLLNTLLNLLRAFLDKDKDPATYVYEWRNDPLFIISLAVLILVIAIVAVSSIMHKFVWEPSYLKQFEVKSPLNFQSSHWGNERCDEMLSNISQVIKVDVDTKHSKLKVKENNLMVKNKEWLQR